MRRYRFVCTAVGLAMALTGLLASSASATPEVEARIVEWSEQPFYVLNSSSGVRLSFECTEGVDVVFESCTDSNGVSAASAGGGAYRGEDELNVASEGEQTFNVVAKTENGVTAESPIHYTVVGPPTAAISRPSSGPYAQGADVETEFSCTQNAYAAAIPAASSLACEEAPGFSGFTGEEVNLTGTSGMGTLYTVEPGEYTYAVGAYDTDTGLEGTAELKYRVAAPPEAQIESAAGAGTDAGTYAVGEEVTVYFSCEEGAFGTEIESCEDSAHAVAPDGSLTGAALNTSEPGKYEYTVTAKSKDGQSAKRSISYTVAAPPVLELARPSEVQDSSATLNATVNPEGGDVEACTFEYGRGLAYGSSVPCASLPGSGTSPVAVSAPVSGLSPGTGYFVRISVTTPADTNSTSGSPTTTRSSYVYFKTQPAPLVIESPTAVEEASATLNATVNPEGGQVTACTFEYGRGLAYGSSVPCASLPGSGTSPVAVSAPVSGLSPGTGYFVRISVFVSPPANTYARSAASVSYSDSILYLTSYVYFKTQPASAIIESPTIVKETSATLNGTVNPKGGDVELCTFEYGRGLAYGSSVPCASLPGSGTSPAPVSAPVSGLSPGTGYFARISVTISGVTTRSSYVYFRTPQAPLIVGSPTAVTSSSATLNATVNPQGSSVATCTFEYGRNLSYGSSVPCATLPGSGTSPEAVSATASGLKAGTGYFVRISVTTGSGPGQSSYIYFRTPEPLPPPTAPEAPVAPAPTAPAK